MRFAHTSLTGYIAPHMNFKYLLIGAIFACVMAAQAAFADESSTQAGDSDSALFRYRDGAQKIIDQALDLVGIRYRRGGDTPQSGFDCSGFVDHVFQETLGLILPRSSRELSKTGTEVSRDELKPGDLVFFRTIRNAISHVGIYVGDHRFVHAPRPGQSVGITDLREQYWAKRYSGARRVEQQQ